MAKGATKAGAILVKLVSTAATGYFYVKRKNPKRMPRKLEFIKYDPRVGLARRFARANAALERSRVMPDDARALRDAGDATRVVHGDEDQQVDPRGGATAATRPPPRAM